MKFGTKVLHAGIKPDSNTGAVMTPIYQTSTYAQEAPGVHKGYEYARTQNPTRTVLEKNLAALENGKYAITFSSGMSAIDAILRLLKPGDEIIAINDLYGGTFRLMKNVYEDFGIKTHFVPMDKPRSISEYINENTRLLWIETPTNPMLNITDIEKVAEIAKKHNIIACVDNTFASPFLQNPLDLGADIVVHSATKYLGGHSDVVMGAIVLNSKKIAKKLYYLQNAVGAIPGPNDCFLVLRGIKTLHLRVERACYNAGEIAKFLVKHPKVENVYYPGLRSHPGHKIAKKQMRNFGAIVSYDLKGDNFKDAVKIAQCTKYFFLAESLGGVESLITHPASMTHSIIPEQERKKVGLTNSLMRLSVGVEDIDDLIDDLRQAFD